MIKFIGYCLLLSSMSAHALVPVEGIILGTAVEDHQFDPLKSIFGEIYDKSQIGENKKLKLYQSTFESGERLAQSCSYLGAPKYAATWNEKQAKRSIAATLQYIGLDTTIKAIGAYAKKMDVDAEGFGKLTKNLVQNYCSKNITIFSLKKIEASLKHYYQNADMLVIPTLESSPFATKALKQNSEKLLTRSKEFDLVIRNFKAFCSWGGETEDYRLLTSYLKNPFIMGFVIKNLLGQQDKVNEKSLKVETHFSPENTVQVGCSELICRKESFYNFKKKFPLSLGSTGVATDLTKLYCHHFIFQDNPKTNVPQVKQWLKSNELEDPIFETSQFLALMTGIPDLFNSVDSYLEIPVLVKSSIDERWSLWAKGALEFFSSDLLYEESLKLKVEPRRDLALLRGEGFQVDFNITVGELDRMTKAVDKLSLTFDLKLSKNYLRSIRNHWAILDENVDTEGKARHKEEIARYLELQLKEKEKLFLQKVWNADLARLIADELLQQTVYYRGNLFESYVDEVLTIPVKFSYGLFALSYLSYRADVAAGRLKLKL